MKKSGYELKEVYMKRYTKNKLAEKLLYIDGVTKIYKAKGREIVANDNITFEVEQGEILGILGPNGAGKTTLIKQIATLLIPDKGDIYYKGTSIVKNPESFLGKFSFLMEGSRNLYGYLPGRINLLYFAYLHKISKKTAEKRIDELLELMGIKDFQNDYVMDYSSGMQKKLSISLCLLTEPSVVFLDEPLSALDVIAAEEITNIIKNIVKEKHVTFIIASHRMDFVEKVTDRVVWLKNGRIVRKGSTHELKSLTAKQMYEVYLRSNDSVEKVLSKEKVEWEKMAAGIIKCKCPSENRSLLQRLICLNEFISVEKVERDFETIFKEEYGNNVRSES